MAGKTPGYGPLNHGKIFAYENIDAQKGNQRDEMDEGVVYPGILQAIWLLIHMFKQAGKSRSMGPPRGNRNKTIQPTSV